MAQIPPPKKHRRLNHRRDPVFFRGLRLFPVCMESAWTSESMFPMFKGDRLRSVPVGNLLETVAELVPDAFLPVGWLSSGS